MASTGDRFVSATPSPRTLELSEHFEAPLEAPINPVYVVRSAPDAKPLEGIGLAVARPASPRLADLRTHDWTSLGSSVAVFVGTDQEDDGEYAVALADHFK